MKLPLTIKSMTTNGYLESALVFHDADGEQIAGIYYLQMPEGCKGIRDSEQNAQTIAHRVNCFEELVAMLEYARESINQSASIFNNSRFTDRHQDGPRCIRAMEAISAALERAKT